MRARSTGAISGQPVAHLVASTSGTDADWVVKLIDVYPDEVHAANQSWAAISSRSRMDILRGRYRESFEAAKPIRPNVPLTYRFALPTDQPRVPAGTRIMVQVQSSWFPLYDRNPQTFVANIFLAKPEDYRKATERIYHAMGKASYVELPIVAAPSSH